MLSPQPGDLFLRQPCPAQAFLKFIRLFELLLQLWVRGRRGALLVRVAVVTASVPVIPGSGAVVGGLVAPVVATATAGGGFGLPLVLTRPGAALLIFIITPGADVTPFAGGVVVTAALGVLFRRPVGS